MQHPQYFVIELREALRPFCQLVSSPELPTVDIDAALAQIVDAVTTLENCDDRLSCVAYYMGGGEGLSEHWIFEDPHSNAELEEKIIHAIVLLGQEIKTNLLQHYAYRAGVCPYTYGSLINATTIVLRRASVHPSAATA